MRFSQEGFEHTLGVLGFDAFWEACAADDYQALTPEQKARFVGTLHRYRVERHQTDARDEWCVLDDCCPHIDENNWGHVASGFDSEAGARAWASGGCAFLEDPD